MSERSVNSPPEPPKPKFPSLFTCLIALVAIVLLPLVARSPLAITSLRHSWQGVRQLSQSRLRTPNTARPPLLAQTANMGTATFSAAEEKQWNRLADGMDRFHSYFRMEFNHIYRDADGGFHKQGMSLNRFLRQAQELASHLDMHHRIEEAHIFPVLAKKMPQFKAGAREGGEHLESHRKIHAGLDKYEAYLEKCLADSSKYSASELREILDSFREVLFRHLDEEVHDLGAESMRAAGWTLAEIRAFHM